MQKTFGSEVEPLGTYHTDTPAHMQNDNMHKVIYCGIIWNSKGLEQPKCNTTIKKNDINL